MAIFLLKTEPDAFSIDDLKREKATTWGGEKRILGALQEVVDTFDFRRKNHTT